MKTPLDSGQGLESRSVYVDKLAKGMVLAATPRRRSAVHRGGGRRLTRGGHCCAGGCYRGNGGLEAELAVVKRRFGAARRAVEADAGGEDFLDTHAFAREWWGAHQAEGEAAAAESEQNWLSTQPAGEVGADARAAMSL